MIDFAALTKGRDMWPREAARPQHGSLNVDARPYLEAVGDAFRIRAVDPWLRELVALLAALVIDAGVVPLPRVHADGDGRGAPPSGGAAAGAAAGEEGPDIGVVLSREASIVLGVVEIEGEAAVEKQGGHVVMAGGEHGPELELGCCRGLCLCFSF